MIFISSGDPLKDVEQRFSKMDSSLPLVFRVFQIIIPTFAVLILCTGICKCCVQSRRRQERRQLAEASARAQEPPPSVYVIPCSPPEEERSGPQHYSLAQQYAPPPYSEFAVKPDFPHDPPPSYTESLSPAFISYNPDRIDPSSPALPP
ncbi:transmembrane protein 92 [Tachysurus ichikawai]